jgi:glycine oxidase
VQANPWFNWLPLTPAKGETLILECPTLDLPRAIYHHRKWLLPYGDHIFRLGATFDNDDASPEPTEAGARELLDAARSFIAPQHSLIVKQHYAGLRPSTKDVRPFIGDHPTEAGLHIFNGLGSKGASLAPELIRQFLAHLLEGDALDLEIDIARFVDTTALPPRTNATH